MNRALIHSGPGGSARWKKGALIIETRDRTITTFYAHSENFKKTIDRASRYKLKRTESWGFSIGQSHNSRSFRNFEDLLQYVGNTENFHSDDYNEYLNLVLFSEKREKLVVHNKS